MCIIFLYRLKTIAWQFLSQYYRKFINRVDNGYDVVGRHDICDRNY